MKNQFVIGLMTIFFTTILFTACKNSSEKYKEEGKKSGVATGQNFQVITNAMDFVSSDTINAGWTKIVYKNLSTEPHFILFDKYPEEKSIIDTKKDVLPPFDEGMALIMEGKNDEAMEAFGKLPEWFSEIVFSGGTGLISPKGTAVSHVNLKPGYYIMECYVKMPDGKFHSSMGMIKELFVVEKENTNQAPDANVEINLSSENGITYEGALLSGKNVIKVNYIDQIVHENFVGHDLSLVYLEAEADLRELERWMNWATPTGLMSSTLPAGITFLGGTNDAPAGSVHYFEADLKPGKYAFVSEVPNAMEKGMLQTFIISE